VIINIEPGTFGGPLRNGDLLGVCNVVEHIRKVNGNPYIRFYLKTEAVSTERYVQDFHTFLLFETNYFSSHPGQETLPWRNVNVWDFRDICGDMVKVPNKKEMEKKIAIFPLFDATYNTYRNWPPKLLETICKKYSATEYDDYEKLICVGKYPFGHEELISAHFKYSFDFMENINHIQTAEIFVGGDTGTTHFAFSLDRGPKDMLYYNSSRALVHTLPFYLLEGKGKMATYWLDFERTQF
jgi:hypothetical protein